MSRKRLVALATVAATLVVVLSVWVYAQFGQRQFTSASASVGTRIANTSASTNVQDATINAGPGSPPPTASFNAQSAVSLMVTDVNNDGKQDIKIAVTTPPLAPAGNLPLGAPARHGVFITDGASGLTLVNIVVSSP